MSLDNISQLNSDGRPQIKKKMFVYSIFVSSNPVINKNVAKKRRTVVLINLITFLICVTIIVAIPVAIVFGLDSSSSTTNAIRSSTTTKTSTKSSLKTTSKSVANTTFIPDNQGYVYLGPSSRYCGLGTLNTNPMLSRSSNYSSGRIVGGDEAKIGNWGWQIYMYITVGLSKYLCGGSLITDQWILTAAHCVHDSKYPSDYSVSVGAHSRTYAQPWTLYNLHVSKVIAHPGYNPYSQSNDLALVKLKNPIQIDVENYRIVPICVPKTSSRFQNINGFATGWGTLYSNGDSSDVLMQVSLPILRDTQCTNSIYSPNIDSNTQVCAGDGTGKDTCQGDSGGPLAARDTDGRWYLVGVTSYGIGCGINPGVYSRPSSFQDWIFAMVKNQ